ncbi:MAG: hypothetical protein LBI28_08050 [Treponema sp.]|jgi:hypothetical protein|nr:hypothetical protein [Treponema sp.]
MKKIFIIVLVSFTFFSCVSGSTSSPSLDYSQRIIINSLPESTETEKYIEYENGFITVQINRAIYYKFNDEPFNAFNLINIYYNKYGEPYYRREATIRKYLNINNRTVEWSIISLTPETAIATYEAEPFFSLIKEGIASFKITVGEIETTINTTIQMLPFGVNATYDNLIEILGFPNKESRGSAVWPSDTKVDFSSYTTTRRGQSISVTHLHYDRYPNVIFAFINTRNSGTVLQDGRITYDNQFRLIQSNINNDLRPKD